MQRATIAFRHCSEGTEISVLRSRLALARQSPELVPDVTRLHYQLTCGALRQEGGAELIGHLGRIFAYRTRPRAHELILLWLIALQTDPVHEHKELVLIAEQVLRGEIRIRDYLPLPVVTAA